MRWRKQCKDRDRDKERGGNKWWPSGMTQHLCQGKLNVPHASLTVTRRRMPGSERCRTKGAVVYHYVHSLLSSLHPPILCLPLQETGPLLLQSGSAVWLIWMWRQRKKRAGGFVEIEGCGGSKPNKLCWEAVLSLLLSTPLSASTRWCVACFHLLTWNATLPLLDNHHVPCRLLSNSRQRGRRVEDKEVGKHAS